LRNKLGLPLRNKLGLPLRNKVGLQLFLKIFLLLCLFLDVFLLLVLERDVEGGLVVCEHLGGQFELELLLVQGVVCGRLVQLALNILL